MGCARQTLLGCVVAVYLCCFFRFGQSCDDGWASHGSKCYKVFLEKNSPFFALLHCTAEDSKLASIPSEGKLLFLSKLITYTSETTFWIGLNIEEGHAEWVDGTLAEHQPYVPQITSQNSHLCPAFNGAKVVMVPCFYMLSFICESDAYNESFHQKCLTDAFAAKHSNHCISVLQHQANLTLSGANQVCSVEGNHVATLEEIFHESVSHFRTHVEDGVNYWLNTKWAHLNSTHFGVFPGAFTSQGSGSCAAISFSFSERFKFFVHQMECEATASVICFSGIEDLTTVDLTAVELTTVDLTAFDLTTVVTSSPPTPTTEQDVDTDTTLSIQSRILFSSPSCPHGYNWKEDPKSGFCFWETSYETTKLSWADARAYCQSYGGDLASFHNVDEERLGLSFQYGSASHSYWIGLSYDRLTDSYSWADGTPFDYENWAPSQKDNLHRRRNCVQIAPSSVHWVLSYCGELCWFICKAPKQLNPMRPVLPTPHPMVHCEGESFPPSFYFDGYCYQTVDISFKWQRAKDYCLNHNSDLVSVHSEREADFLIRLMNQPRDLTGNRVWIGLNSHGYQGRFFWSDGSTYDYTLWDDNEPNNIADDEHCVNMYITSAFWNDENCNGRMAFICKKRSSSNTDDTSVSPTELALVGNCPKGWYTFNNRCFMIIGQKREDQKDFLNASSQCMNDGGYLASIRNAKEQAFMAFLIQNLKSDMWIGLSDRDMEAQYRWMDHSPLVYTNWVEGGPETFDSSDCVFLSYNSSVSGRWRSSDCKKKLPFICQKSKNASITVQAEPKTLHCIYPPGWLKQDMSCYMLFSNESSFADAKKTCGSYQANLVSISDSSVEAAVNYLSAGSDKSYWIGLLIMSNNKFKWSNGWPMSISRWDLNQPRSAENRDNCFMVSSSGLWSQKNCSEKMPFICQVTATYNQPSTPQVQKGSCPSDEWVDVGDENCYLFKSSFTASSWSQANFNCYSRGGNLISFHSTSQISKVKTYLHNEVNIWVTGYFIGLIKNENGGFAWSDLSPVDFVNWAQAEPEDPSLHCVLMHPDTMKWHTTSCYSAKDYICSIKKEVNESLNSSEKLIHSLEGGQGLSGGVITAIVLVVLFAVLITATAVVMYFYPMKISWSRLQSDRVTSFENALYKTDLTVENPDIKTLYVHD